MKTWQLQEAKAKFSRVVKLANAGEPQLITRNGEPAAYIISTEEYKKNNKLSMKEILLNSPHKDVEIPLERSTELSRNIEL